MDVVRLNPAGIRRATAVLRAGGVVVVPTETSYALAADATNRTAVARIRMLKGRGRKPMAVMAASSATVSRFFQMDPLSARLARRHWPGPLTLVLPARDVRLARSALGSGGKVGVRVPGLPAARALCARLGRALVATSANISGKPACRSKRAFLAQFRGRNHPDLFLDAGALPRRRPSTVIRVSGRRFVVLRSGPIRL